MIVRLPLIGTRVSAHKGDSGDKIRPVRWQRFLPEGLYWEARLIEESLDLENAEAEYEITALDPSQQAELNATLQDFESLFPGVGDKRAWANAGDYTDRVRMRRVKPDSRIEPLESREERAG